MSFEFGHSVEEGEGVKSIIRQPTRHLCTASFLESIVIYVASVLNLDHIGEAVRRAGCEAFILIIPRR